jgi:dynein heavy chain 2
MDTWSQESMGIISQESFSCSESLRTIEDKDMVIKELLAIHQSCFYNGATPKHFIQFLAMYEFVYRTKKECLVRKQKYLEGVKIS